MELKKMMVMNKMKSKDNKGFIDEFLDKKNVFAVIGVSKNHEKYGYKVYRNLKDTGYKVYPINPNTDKVLEDRCYIGLENLPEKPDVVNIVVPPNVTEEIVRECKRLGINKVWMQPGSESKKSIDYCKNKGIKVLYGICVIIERGKIKK